MTIQERHFSKDDFLNTVHRLTCHIKDKQGEPPESLDKYKACLSTLIKAGNEHFKTAPELSKKKWTLLSKEARSALSPSFFSRHKFQTLTLVSMASAAVLLSPQESRQAFEAILPLASDIPGVPFFQLWWLALQTLAMATTYLCEEGVSRFDQFVGAEVGAPLLLCTPFAIYAAQVVSRLFNKYFNSRHP